MSKSILCEKNEIQLKQKSHQQCVLTGIFNETLRYRYDLCPIGYETEYIHLFKIPKQPPLGTSKLFSAKFDQMKPSKRCYSQIVGIAFQGMTMMVYVCAHDYWQRHCLK